MMRTQSMVKPLAGFGCLLLLVILSSCQNQSTPVVSVERIPQTEEVNATDAKRLSDGATKLLAAMKRPTRAFRFDYKGQENLSSDKTREPAVGSVTLLADVSPEEIRVAETRGTTTSTSHARYGDDFKWGIANLKILQVMTNPTLAIALGASVTNPPSIDLVEKTSADRFMFDTAVPSTISARRGLATARLVVTTIQNCKGKVWIAEDSGQLVKFNIDADLSDSNHHAWKEHYDGLITPK